MDIYGGTDGCLDLMKANFVQPAIASNMTTTMTSLQDTMTNLERIRNTPLPFAYQAHLRMSLWYVNGLLLDMDSPSYVL